MQQPIDQHRIFSASDVAQFEHCPLAWWYEEVTEVAQADEVELAQKLAELEEEYGTSAAILPEHQVLERLLRRARFFEAGEIQHARSAGQQAKQGEQPGREDLAGERGAALPPLPRIVTLLVVSLVLLTIALLAFGLLLWSQ